MQNPITIANRTAVKVNGRNYKPGDVIPRSVCEAMGEAECQRLYDMKAIAVVEGDPDTDEPVAKLHHPGRWNMDPATLADKTLDQLNAILAEKNADAMHDKAKAVAFLSSEFSPTLDPPPAPLLLDDDTPQGKTE